MHTTQGNLLQSLRAVKEFLDDNAQQLGDVVTTGTRTKLDQIIAALEKHVAEQAGSVLAASRASRKRAELTTALLRDHMAPIARIAQADLPHVAGNNVLRLPRTNVSTERLAAAAEGMALEAAPYAEHFVQAGLPADFIARLTAAADALVQSVSERVTSRGRRSGATKGVKATLQSARKLVHVIDAFVTSTLANDPALLANWKRVKRVRRVAVRSDEPTTPALPPAAPSLAALTAGDPGERKIG